MNITEVDWEKAVGRKADLQKAIQFSCNGAGGFGRFFGINDLAHQLYYFNGRVTAIYFSRKEYAKFLELAHGKLDDLQFLKKCETQISNICDGCIRKAQRLGRAGQGAKSRKELLVIFKKFNDVWNDFYPIGWAFFFISGFENSIRRRMNKLGIDKQSLEELMKICIKSGRLTPTMESELAVLKLAGDIKLRRKSIQKQVKKISDEFGWMSVYNTEDEARSPEYYIKEAKKIIKSDIDIDGKIKSTVADIQNNEKEFQLYLKSISDRLLREQLIFLHLAGYLRDKREEARDRVTIFEKSLYSAIAKNCGLKLREVVYLTNEEIRAMLNKELSKESLRRIAKKRVKSYVFTISNGRLSVIDDLQEKKKIKEFLRVAVGIGEVNGQIAFGGREKVRGLAKIILNNKELGKIKEGDVLVATMTKPDFLVAMKKAVAIVTDEGGITCHAAIVARELRKPCIIGTKVATQILKDGDLVEVDTNKGIVRVINKRGVS